jgi:hypothetical protein
MALWNVDCDQSPNPKRYEMTARLKV